VYKRTKMKQSKVVRIAPYETIYKGLTTDVDQSDRKQREGKEKQLNVELME